MTITEGVESRSLGLDLQQPESILALLLDGQLRALNSVSSALPQIVEAAARLAACVRGGGTVAYAAAGSSALMAMADGLELPGTFGIPGAKVKCLIAGGAASLSDLVGSTEDDADQGARDIGEVGLARGDCLIGVSASGTTPYTLAALRAAANAGAFTIGVANNAGAALLEEADAAILLPTPPEIISGSTRMGAATAQKAALNLMSTLMAVELGHVHDGHMVNLRADNAKLNKRASRIVSDIGGCDEVTSQRLLARTQGSVKHAILLAAGVSDARSADDLLRRHQGKLRNALAAVERG
ncbi:MAG: N-acetylmuramic acid 6-phosphate etherase [Rhizobiaceae bacterium]|nr:N-acetylmuramic acid 6-phosphate etherase [Rhizobiaceae bacterium]